MVPIKSERELSPSGRKNEKGKFREKRIVRRGRSEEETYWPHRVSGRKPSPIQGEFTGRP